MLRLHFTVEDLARVRLAPGPDAMWELTLSIHQLAFPTQHLPFFGRWRHRTARRLSRDQLGGDVRSLAALMPAASYFPDFVTPAEQSTSFQEGLDTVLRTPKTRLREEIHLLASGYRQPPSWMHSLAGGRADALTKLGGMMRRYHASVVEPHTASMSETIRRDLAYRRDVLASGGVRALLSGLHPGISWESGVLRLRYPVDRDIHLEGRGLLLIPSFFCVHGPVSLADRSLPPVLVYPVRRPELWLNDSEATPEALDELVGKTRATVLRLLDEPRTISGVAAIMNVAPSTVSRHATVMRKTGLVRGIRDGERILLTRSELGQSLLDG